MTSASSGPARALDTLSLFGHNKRAAWAPFWIPLCEWFSMLPKPNRPYYETVGTWRTAAQAGALWIIFHPSGHRKRNHPAQTRGWGCLYVDFSQPGSPGGLRPTDHPLRPGSYQWTCCHLSRLQWKIAKRRRNLSNFNFFSLISISQPLIRLMMFVCLCDPQIKSMDVCAC